MSYIDRLLVSEEVRGILRSLGAETPEALLGLIQAEPQTFERSIGGDVAQRIRSALREMVPEDVREPFETRAPAYSLGAELRNAPLLPDPGYDVDERDRLFAELQQLQSGPSERHGARISQLEKQLNAMLGDRDKS